MTCSNGEPADDKLEMVGSDGRCAIQDGNKLSIDDVALMLGKMRADLLDTLRSNFLLGLDTGWLNDLLGDPNLDLKENMRSVEVGYNFISSNPQLSCHCDDLIIHLFGTKQHHRFVSGYGEAGNLIYNRRALMQLIEVGDACMLEFAKGNHLSAGEPMRGDEYASFNICKTNTGNRAFFWRQSDKSVLIWQTYTKTEGFGHPVKNIIRLMAPDWLEIFFILEVLVRPALIFIASKLWPENNNAIAGHYKTDWLLRRGEPVTGQQFGTSLADSFVENVHFPAGLLQWRHWAVHFGDYIKKEYGTIRSSLPLDEQAGHTEQTAGQVYATKSTNFRGIDRHKVQAFCEASKAWHVVFKCDQTRPWLIDKAHPVQPTVVSTCQTHDSSSQPPVMNVKNRFQPAPTVYLPVPVPYQQSAEPHLIVTRPSPPQNILHSINAWDAMHQLGYGDWTCEEQALAAALVVENSRSIGVILPTGFGKSLLFHIPPKLHQGKMCTVVIVFLAELRIAHMLEAEKKGISACIYQSSSEFDWFLPPSLIILGPEQADSTDFQENMRLLAVRKSLFAIFLDEAHLIFESYRDVMSRLLPLSGIGVPIIAMTATLAPGEEYRIHVLIGRDLNWIRRLTVRPNIAYFVDECSNIDQGIVSRLSSWMKGVLQSRERAILYCWTRSEVERMHQILRHAGFLVAIGHSGCDRNVNSEQRRLFEQGTFNILVTSPQLGCGYNYPFVTLVLHRVMARSIKDYIQQSGRCGRSGQYAEARIITNQAAVREHIIQTKRIDKSDKENPGLLQMESYIKNNNTCRRWTLHSVVDGVPVQCFLITNGSTALCDRCQKGKTAWEEIASNERDNYNVTSNTYDEDLALLGNELWEDISFGEEQPKDHQTLPDVDAHGTLVSPSQQTIPDTPYTKSVTQPPGKKTTSDTRITTPQQAQHRNQPAQVHITKNPYQQSKPAAMAISAAAASAQAAVIEHKMALSSQMARRVLALMRLDVGCLTCFLEVGKQHRHDVLNCPAISIGDGFCCRCLGKHNRNICIDTKHRKEADFTCTKCGVYTRRIGPKGNNAIEPHAGEYGKKCQNGANGDCVRLLVWRKWRQERERRRLCAQIPELVGITTDAEFASRLYKKPDGPELPLYCQILSSIAQERNVG
jgi:superfamily II DNA or RNA helicase